MEINLTVKVKGGPRTPIDVAVYYTAVNEKSIRFGNGKVISGTAIAEWIAENLEIALKKIELGA